MSTIKNRYITSFLILTLISSSSSQTSSATRVTPPVTKCYLRVDNPHLSDSIKKQKGFEAVKVNAVSACNKDIFYLQITVEIRKKGFLLDHEVAKRSIEFKGFIPAKKRIAHKGTWRKCDDKKASEYYGVAYAVAIIEGQRMQTLPVRTAKNISLPCGT
jgi:hypothetical protein